MTLCVKILFFSRRVINRQSTRSGTLTVTLILSVVELKATFDGWPIVRVASLDSDQGDDESSSLSMGGDHMEIVGARLTTMKEFPPKAWISLTYAGKDTVIDSPRKNTNIQKPIDNSFSENHKWWIFKERFPITKDSQIKIEASYVDLALNLSHLTFTVHYTQFKAQFDKIGVIVLGSAVVLASSLGEDVCDIELSSASSAGRSTEFSDIDLDKYSTIVAVRIEPKRPPPAPDPITGKIKKPRPILGTVRVTTWQGKNVQSSYPVYLEVLCNQLHSRKYRSAPVNNPHNPIFDYTAVQDLVSMQGDIIVVLREKHAMRSNRAVGQVAIPLSWLVDKIPVSDVHCKQASITGWFEMFPHCKPTRLNRSGQYRPYIAGMPASSGYGVEKPDKPLGFLKVEVEVTLQRPMLYTLMRYPFCHMPNPDDDDMDEDTGLASVYVARNNVKRIIAVARLPLYMSTFLDIIHWKTHWSITFVALFLHSYAFLLAPVWLFPLLLMSAVFAVGVLAARSRSYAEAKLFVEKDPDEGGIGAGSAAVASDDDHKSIADRYKSFKAAVLSLEMQIEAMAQLFEQCNNLMLLSDPLLSISAFLAVLLLACMASFFLFFISPNTFVFLMGLALFAPEDAVLRAKVLANLSVHSVTSRFKRTLRYLRRKKVLGLGGPPLIPGEYLHRLPTDTTLPRLKQHALSGFLYSKAWPDPNVRPDKPTDAAIPKERHWSSHWCEVWQIPGVFKVTVRTQGNAPPTSSTEPTSARGDGVVSVAERKREIITVFDLQDVTATYLGKVVIEKKLKREGTDRSLGSDDKRMSTKEASKERFSSSLRTLHMFQVSQIDSKIPPRNVVGEQGSVHRTNGWVFSCKTLEEAEEWVRVVNFTSQVATNMALQSITSPETHLTMRVDEATGGLVAVDATALQMQAARGRKVSELAKKYIHRFVRMVPDDLELMHRYFCQQQFMEEGTELGRMGNKKLEWNLASELSDFIPTVSKFNPATSRPQRGINTLTRHKASVDTAKYASDARKGLVTSLESSEGDFIGSIVVTVISARGLPLKEISSAMNMGGPFTLVMPKLFVQISIVPSSISALVYKSGGQPRGPSAVFREDFLFADLNLTRAVEKQARLVAFVLLRTPLSLGGETYTVIGTADYSLSPLICEVFPSLGAAIQGRSNRSGSSESKDSLSASSTSAASSKREHTDWFPLFDKHTGLALPDNAALQLKMKYVGG